VHEAGGLPYRNDLDVEGRTARRTHGAVNLTIYVSSGMGAMCLVTAASLSLGGCSGVSSTGVHIAQ
jgi:hypothetical protein